jgi:hypothetical protein
MAVIVVLLLKLRKNTQSAPLKADVTNYMNPAYNPPPAMETIAVVDGERVLNDTSSQPYQPVEVDGRGVSVNQAYQPVEVDGRGVSVNQTYQPVEVDGRGVSVNQTYQPVEVDGRGVTVNQTYQPVEVASDAHIPLWLGDAADDQHV